MKWTFVYSIILVNISLSMFGLSNLYSQFGGLYFSSKTESKIYDTEKDTFLLFDQYIPLSLTGDELNSNPVIFGVIDSGVWEDHPQIQPFVEKYRDFTGMGKEDVANHGTWVTLNWISKLNYQSKLAKDSIGVDSNISFHIAKIVHDEEIDFKNKRNTNKVYKRLLEALEWLTSNDSVRFINISLGIENLDLKQQKKICNLILNDERRMYTIASPELRAKAWPACCPTSNKWHIMVSGVENSLCKTRITAEEEYHYTTYSKDMVYFRNFEEYYKRLDAANALKYIDKYVQETDYQFGWIRYIGALLYFHEYDIRGGRSNEKYLYTAQILIIKYERKFGQNSLFYNFFLGRIYYYFKNYEEALTYLNKTLELMDDFKQDSMVSIELENEAILTIQDEKSLISEVAYFELLDALQVSYAEIGEYCKSLDVHNSYKDLNWSSEYAINILSSRRFEEVEKKLNNLCFKD